jgi:hypothetical protein
LPHLVDLEADVLGLGLLAALARCDHGTRVLLVARWVVVEEGVVDGCGEERHRTTGGGGTLPAGACVVG